MPNSPLQIEDIFSSKLRVKILKILWQLCEVNVSEIARRLRVNHKTTIEHLKLLEAEGIIQHKTFGRIRLYRFNEASPKTKAIQRFLEAWELAEKGQK